MGPFINENKIGETFQPYDIQDLVEKMLLILKNPKRYVGPQRINLINKYSWEAQENKLLSVFDEIAFQRLVDIK
jgi:glycosyltransferase involved in cell wall biosynthesis